jgi:hypothetical protein
MGYTRFASPGRTKVPEKPLPENARSISRPCAALVRCSPLAVLSKHSTVSTVT